LAWYYILVKKGRFVRVFLFNGILCVMVDAHYLSFVDNLFLLLLISLVWIHEYQIVFETSLAYYCFHQIHIVYRTKLIWIDWINVWLFFRINWSRNPRWNDAFYSPDIRWILIDQTISRWNYLKLLCGWCYFSKLYILDWYNFGWSGAHAQFSGLPITLPLRTL